LERGVSGIVAKSALREGAVSRPVRLIAATLAALLLLSLVTFSYPKGGDSSPATNGTDHTITDKLHSIDGYFIENRGQVTEGVRYYSRGNPSVAFRDDGVMFVLTEQASLQELRIDLKEPRRFSGGNHEPHSLSSLAYLLRFEGANKVKPIGTDRLSFDTNYFIGENPSGWRANVPNYGEVVYQDLYDGIDLVYQVKPEGLKYEFRVRPGADIGQIRLSYEGVDDVDSSSGSLVVKTAFGDTQDSTPVSFDDLGTPVFCDFSMQGSNSYGFSCEDWEPSRSLTIDPLIYSTFLGGNQPEMYYAAMKVDVAGNAYVAGLTMSPNFPVTPGAFDTTFDNLVQGFVTKLNADGSSLAYSTFIGEGYNTMGLALDSTGSAYVCGEGYGPVTPGAYNQGGGSGDAIVVRLSPGGNSLIFGARIGGDEDDGAIDVDIDSAGNVYLFGDAYSRDFPVTPGAYDTTHNGGTYDLFVAKFNPSASTLLFSTYIGGSNFEYGTDMALDAAGYPYLTGWTGSDDFPTTPGAYDRSFTYYDSYVVKVNVTGSSLMYSTFLNGVEAFGIAADAGGYAYVTGRVDETTFPTTPGAYDTTANGELDAFVTKFNTMGSGLVYSTRLGGSDTDLGTSVIVNSQGHAVLTGLTYSVGFPVTPGAMRTCFGGSGEVFVTEFDSGATSLVYSTYFGGSKHDEGDSVGVDSSGAYIVAGGTVSSDYPVTSGAFDTTYGGGNQYEGDFFVTKLDQTPGSNNPPTIMSFDIAAATEGSPAKFAVKACDSEGDPLTYSFDFESDGVVDVTGPNNTVYHTWGDDYEGTATVNVSDGKLSSIATMDFTIMNVIPSISVSPPAAGNEGDTFPLSVRVTDPGSDDITVEWSASCAGSSTPTVYPNDPSNYPDPYPSPELNPRDITESQNVTCGDDGVFSWSLRVTDDDGGEAVKSGTFTVKNLPPTLSVQPPSLTQVDEGVLMTLTATATDPGSDDIKFRWYGECSGWLSPVSYPNDPTIFPDPDPSPQVNPRNVTNTQRVVCGDDGLYSWRLTVEDDDGGSASAYGDISTSNVAPSLVVNGGMIIDEGQMVNLIAIATDQGSDDLTFDWSWGEGSSESRTYFNDGLSPDPPRSPNGTFPFTAVDEATHAYGDNGVYTVTLTVTDDDGGSTTWQKNLIVNNLPPKIEPIGPFTVNEGDPLSISASAEDPGSDDLTFTWKFELGPTVLGVHYNDGLGPDPPSSPGGIYPFTANDAVAHTYGDDGIYVLILTVTDDDGGSTTFETSITVVNLPPNLAPFGPFSVSEGGPLSVSAYAYDPGSDDLTFTWVLEYGPTFDHIFYNDGIGPDPLKSPDGIFPFTASDSVDHTYGDNGVFNVSLKVLDDDGGTATYETSVTVGNVPPTITDVEAFMLANITLRVAGEKWHDVVLRLYEGGNETGHAQVIRYPGSPDDQSTTLHDVKVSLTRDFSAVAYYTPDDDPINGQPNGADPAWIIFHWENGNETTLHHTFNVQQNDTWVWRVENVIVYAVNQIVHFRATATDPGSDDLTFVWDTGDGRMLTGVYYNDGIGPDPYPSPNVNPMTATDERSVTYSMAGAYTIVLTVSDDDGGSAESAVVLMLP